MGVKESENMLGAVPWGDSLPTWIARNPLMNLNLIKTPLRFEHNRVGVFSWWDTYNLLRRQHKPVEFITFPYGAHSLIQPLQRLDSQQGNVEWFVFWLKGEEDPDPAKAEQYKRWHKLRELHKADLPKAEKARAAHKAKELNRK